MAGRAKWNFQVTRLISCSETSRPKSPITTSPPARCLGLAWHGPHVSWSQAAAPVCHNTTAMAIKILYVGAGAVGGFYASRTEQGPGVQVGFVARSNYGVLREKGLRLKTRTFGEYHFAPDYVFPNVQAAAAADRWDYVVVTTKALPDHVDDSQTIAPLVAPPDPARGWAGTCVVLIQNGVGVENAHRRRFPLNPIVSAVTVISAEQESPGVVRQNRWTRISLGPYTGPESGPALGPASTDAMHTLARLWTEGGIKDVETHDETDLQLIRWHKLTINSAFNPSAVLAGGVGNARMSLDPELRTHLAGVMEEIWRAAPAVLGRPFPAHLAGPAKILASSERNTGSKPSMLLDWEAGRTMELEVILGNPVRLARQRGVDMPRTHTLYALLKMAQTRRDEERKAKL